MCAARVDCRNFASPVFCYAKSDHRFECGDFSHLRLEAVIYDLLLKRGFCATKLYPKSVKISDFGEECQQMSRSNRAQCWSTVTSGILMKFKQHDST